jgi:hypothetical protein
MIRISSIPTIALLVTVIGCSQGPEYSEENITVEAQAFMAEYAAEISVRNAEGVAARYSRLGAYQMGHGRKQFNSYDSIRVGYVRRWEGRSQHEFEWRDLSYEVLGPDAVLVAGKIEWSRGDSAEALKMSYTGVLVRQGGEWRILLEDESR